MKCCALLGTAKVQNDRPDWLRVLSYAIVLLLIILLNEVTSTLTASMDTTTRGLIGTGVFFGTFVLMYLALVAFLGWEDGGDIIGLGIQDDGKTISHLIVGAIAGGIAILLVYFIAFYLGGDLRSAVEINADLIVSEVMITLPVAVFEELSYRGYLMTRMERLGGRTTAIIGSSIWFSLLHFGWWIPLGSVPWHMIMIYTFNMFLGGVVLCYSYYMSGHRLWVPIAFHFTWNILGYVLFPLYPRELVLMPEVFQFEWGITTIPAFILGLSLVWVLLQELKNKK
ncbi:MAG: CPBP family intramembrane glutamic endopeptidase [Candidatus Thorarchaeota archaeon]